MKHSHYKQIQRWVFLILSAWIVLGYGVSGCSKKQDLPAGPVKPPAQSLQDILNNNYSFSLFDSSLRKTGLMQQLAGDSLYTLLAPDNDAFAAAGITADSLSRMDNAMLKAWLAYHIIPGDYSTGNVPQTIGNRYLSVSGQPVWFSKPLINVTNNAIQQLIDMAKRTLHINGIAVKQSDIKASNGVLHVLSKPLKLPFYTVKGFLDSSARYSLYVAALKRFNLYDQLDGPGPFTLFAPDNDAFLQNGIGAGYISSDTFNSAHYYPYLFSAGILSNRIFLTDFKDAPVFNHGAPTNAVFNSIRGFVDFGDNFNPHPPVVYSWYLMFEGTNIYNQIGPNPGYRFSDQPAYNGVIHGLNDIMIYPDSMYIVH